MGVGPDPRDPAGAASAPAWRSDDIDLVELNEAFASQSLACQRELGIDHDKLNVNGGAIAIGHPLGASGARLIGTLARELRRRGGRYGSGHDVHRRRPGPGHRHREPRRMIDFELTDEQKLIRDTAREFADNEIAPRARENDRAERFDHELVAKMAELGFIGPILPDEAVDFDAFFQDVGALASLPLRGSAAVADTGPPLR